MAILSLLTPFIPYILIAIAAAAAYFGIRHQGVKAERERQEAAQDAAREIVEEKIHDAESKDAEIDARAKREIDAIKTKVDTDSDFTGDRFKF